MSQPRHPRRSGDDDRRFIDDLATRGEAAPRGTEPFPADATHEIVEERGGVPSKVRRRRFSLAGDEPPEPGPVDDPEPQPRVTTVFFDLGNTLGTPVVSPSPPQLTGFDVFDFAVPVLTELRDRGLRLGIISNTGDDDGTAVDAILDRAGIRDFFEAPLRIYSRDVGLRKDSPAIFRLAAERAAEPPASCMFVGEDPAERAFAQQAGLQTVADPRLVANALSS